MMKRFAVSTVSAVALLTMSVGCVSTAPDKYFEYKKQLASQQRMGDTFTLSGPVSIDVGVGGTMTVSQQLRELTPLPYPPSTVEKVVDGVTGIFKLGLGVWGMTSAIDSLSTTRNPVVVEQPAPIIVEPFFAP